MQTILQKALQIALGIVIVFTIADIIPYRIPAEIATRSLDQCDDIANIEQIDVSRRWVNIRCNDGRQVVIGTKD